MKNKTLKKLTFSLMVATGSIAPFLSLVEVYASHQMRTRSVQKEEARSLQLLEEKKSSYELTQEVGKDFSLSDWAYEENAKYIILVAARNDRESIYIPSEFNGKQVILEDLKIFPKTMKHLVIEEVNKTKVGIKISDFSYSFSDYQVETLDLRGLDTSKVTSMKGLFCSGSIKSINIDGWNTVNVTDMSEMFSGAYQLTTLDVSSLDTQNVTMMNRMFAGMSELTALDLSTFNTSKVTEMFGMFNGLSKVSTLDLSSFVTTKVTTMEDMFGGMESLKSLDLRHFNTSKVTNMSSMFAGTKNLTSLNISTFNTSNVENMGGMFNGMESIKTLDLKNFNTSKVTNMSSMFSEMKSLNTLDITSFDTSQVVSMSSMFSGNNLSFLDLHHFETLNVRDMSSMFAGMGNIISLDLSYFDTLNVENVGGMFAEMHKLKELDLISFDLKKIEHVGGMFGISEPKSHSLIIFANDSKLHSYDFKEDQRRASVMSYSIPTITSNTLSGVAPVGTEIKLSVGGESIHEIIVGSDKKYELSIPKQTVGSTLNIEVTTPLYEITNKKLVVRDEFKNFSLETVPLPSTQTIYGTGVPGAEVSVYLTGGEVLDIATVNAEGDFKLNIPKQEVNTILYFQQTKKGYLPIYHKLAVFDELTVFEIPYITINTTIINGKGVPGAKVGIYKNDGNRLAITTVNTKGEYKLTIPKQKAGTELTVKQAKTGYGTLSEKISVLDEFTSFNINNVTTSSVAIYGKGVPGAKVKAFVDGQSISSSFTVNSKGNYKLTIPKQKAGTIVQVKIAKNGYLTTSKKTTVLNELKTFTNSALSTSTTTVSGKGISGAKVGVYTSAGKQLASATVDSKGNYKLTIKKQKAGTKLVLKQTKSGYLTLSKEVTVLNEIKTFTYNTPGISTTTVSGKGISGAKVGVYTSAGKQLAITTVDSKGAYKLTIPRQKAGTKLVLKQTKSGYVTLSKNVTVLNEFKTFTYPTIKKTSTTIKGKGVAGAKVGVYTSTGKRLAITTVNSKGTYKLTIPKQKTGTKLVIKQAKSGYLTASKEVTVVKG